MKGEDNSGRPVVVCVAGGFDPIHKGHIKHIKKARKLGDYLVVIISRNDQMIQKKNYRLLPLEDRKAVIEELRSVDEVVVNIDKDTGCAETLRMIRPNIFAKGGDRTPDNMPASEVEACREIGCKIVYGIGKQLGSSSNYVEKAWLQLAKRREIVEGL